MSGLAGLLEEWRNSREHTYSSENADHYRGFDAGQLRAAQALDPFVERLKGLEQEWHDTDESTDNPARGAAFRHCAYQLHALIYGEQPGDKR